MIEIKTIPNQSAIVHPITSSIINKDVTKTLQTSQNQHQDRCNIQINDVETYQNHILTDEEVIILNIHSVVDIMSSFTYFFIPSSSSSSFCFVFVLNFFRSCF